MPYIFHRIVPPAPYASNVTILAHSAVRTATIAIGRLDPRICEASCKTQQCSNGVENPQDTRTGGFTDQLVSSTRYTAQGLSGGHEK